MNNNNTTKNEYSELNIDKRMLPLFSTPLLLKKLNDQKRNKYNLDNLNPQKKLTYKVISLNEILEIYLKGINLYKLNLNNYLLKENKLDLILNTNTKDENYKLNFSLNKFLYCLKRYSCAYNLNSLLYKIRLFLPGRLLKGQPNIKYKYRTTYLKKLQLLIYKENYILENNNSRREINKLIEKGKEFEKDLDYLINQSKNQIMRLISTNKIENANKSIINLQDLSFYQEKKSNDKVSTTQKEKLNLYKESNKKLISLNTENTELRGKMGILIDKKIMLEKIMTLIKKRNKNKVEDLMVSANKIKNLDINKDTISIDSNPVSVIYLNNNTTTEKKPIINQYLKSMSNYNMQSKGIFIYYSNIVSFNFNSETNKLIKNIYSLLASSFKSMYCLISKPVFVITPDKIIIQLFYYLFIPNLLKFKKIHKAVEQGYNNRNKLKKRKIEIKKQYRKFRKIKIKVRIRLRQLSNITLSKVYQSRIKKLCGILSSLFNKPVELDLIRLHYPYNDSNILVNLLGIMINKIKLRIILRKLFEKAVIKNLKKITGKTKVNIIPAFLSGISIRVAGRLLTHRVIPRQTLKITRRGASARGKINYSDVARYTNKNKRGAFSITVSSGQNFFN
jgi:hypothetical protein